MPIPKLDQQAVFNKITSELFMFLEGIEIGNPTKASLIQSIREQVGQDVWRLIGDHEEVRCSHTALEELYERLKEQTK